MRVRDWPQPARLALAERRQLRDLNTWESWQEAGQAGLAPGSAKSSADDWECQQARRMGVRAAEDIAELPLMGWYLIEFPDQAKVVKPAPPPEQGWGGGAQSYSWRR